MLPPVCWERFSCVLYKADLLLLEIYFLCVNICLAIICVTVLCVVGSHRGVYRKRICPPAQPALDTIVSNLKQYFRTNISSQLSPTSSYIWQQIFNFGGRKYLPHPMWIVDIKEAVHFTPARKEREGLEMGGNGWGRKIKILENHNSHLFPLTIFVFEFC